MNLKDKVAVVTGGSSGIGRAIAVALAKDGCKVVFTYNSNEKGADETLNALGGGEKASKFKVDIRKENEIDALYKFIEEKFGKLDILVNNAGKTLMGDNLDLKLWRGVFDITLFPAIKFTSGAVNLMKLGGRILNISSIFGDDHANNKKFVPFGAAKAALNNFTSTMAKNLGPKILINGIMPGYVLTPLWGDISEADIKSNSAETLINKFIMPSEVADIALAIIKNDAMTGEVVVVDGGLSLKTV